MRDFTKQYEGRKHDVMFYADDEALTVDAVQAFTCPPNDDNVRWVPEKGYSVSVGGTLFANESAAAAALKRKAIAERERLVKRLARLDAIINDEA